MARTVVAIYDDLQAANRAVRDLVDNGVPRDNISVIANNRGATDETVTRREDVSTGDNVADETGAGAGVGAGIGAAIGGIGGLLVGLGALTIPGIGPVIAAGPLAVALSTLTGAGVGAVAGGVTGGLLGALVGLGVPEEEAGYYVEGVRRGGILVTVQADDANTDHIMDVLNRHNPMDINERASQWRSEGWTGYRPNAEDRNLEGGTHVGSGPVDTGPSVMDQQTRQSMPSDRSDYITDRERASGQDMYPPTDREQNFDRDFNRDRTTDMDRDFNRDRTGDEYRQAGTGHMGSEGEVYPRDEFNQRTAGGGFSSDVGSYGSVFDRENPTYRGHYDSYFASSGYPYDYYVPAYQYGYNLRSDTRFANRDWDTIEYNVREDWEREHPGTWERFKDAIRHAWQDLTD